MKKKYVILLFLVIIIFGGCEDLLEVTPENSVTFKNGFQSEKDIVSALNMIENDMRSFFMFADQGEYSDYYPAGSLALLSPAAIPYSTFNVGYSFIVQANVVLPYITKVNMPRERENFYLGQVYFYKAFSYLRVIRVFGDGPLMKDDLLWGALAKSSWPVLADYAIDMAKKAVELLPDFNQMTDYNGNAVSYKSTPCKGTASAVLAHLCAWKAGCKYIAQPEDRNYDEMKLWEMAEQACTDIIKNKDLYDLEGSAEEMCTKALVGDSREIIYEGIRRGLSQEIVHNTSEFCWGTYYQGWPVIVGENPGQIKDKEWRIYAETVRRMYPGKDERKYAFFYKLDSMQYDVSEDITGGYAYPYKWRIPVVATEGWNAGQFINFDQNNVIYRLADIILLRAECRARLGGKYTEGAVSDLNRVRIRSKAALYDASEYGGDLRYAIFKEREKELLMEDTRYWDVIRNGYARTELQGGFRTATDQDFIDGAFFKSIGVADFEGNPLMRQNVYWAKRM